MESLFSVSSEKRIRKRWKSARTARLHSSGELARYGERGISNTSPSSNTLMMLGNWRKMWEVA